MDLHSGARSCPRSRALLIQRVTTQGWTVGRAANAAGISRQTAHKWLARYRAEGEPGLGDRGSRPQRMPRLTPAEWRQLILELRQSRLTGIRIATQLKLPRSTVARVLQRAGLSRLRALVPPEPVRRYERAHPGELLHLDVKKLGRISGFYGHRITGDRRRRREGAGWDYVHVAIDDHSRLAYVEVLRDERGDSTVAFLRRAIAWFQRLGVRMSDNGSAYVSRLFAHTCAVLQLKHLRTRPYRPCTNGKAERFIQTLLREWAYAVPYRTSGLRARALRGFLGHYNRKRPHTSLCGRPPISRLRTADCQQRA